MVVTAKRPVANLNKTKIDRLTKFISSGLAGRTMARSVRSIQKEQFDSAYGSGGLARFRSVWFQHTHTLANTFAFNAHVSSSSFPTYTIRFLFRILSFVFSFAFFFVFLFAIYSSRVPAGLPAMANRFFRMPFKSAGCIVQLRN